MFVVDPRYLPLKFGQDWIRDILNVAVLVVVFIVVVVVAVVVHVVVLMLLIQEIYL